LVTHGPLLQISAQSIATRALASMLERSAEIKNMGGGHALRANFGFSERRTTGECNNRWVQISLFVCSISFLY
jgi:hypothetical protein